MPSASPDGLPIIKDLRDRDDTKLIIVELLFENASALHEGRDRRLAGAEAKHQVLARPFGRHIAQPDNSHSVWKPSINGCLHEVARQEGEGDRHVDPPQAASFAVCNAFGHETAIAEYILMVMLVWSHRFREIEGDFRTHSSWRPSWVHSGAPHGEILGSIVGIIGLGRVGREVARRAAAFGCRVIAANRTAQEPGSGVERVFALRELDRMLPECDYVLLCTALGPETEGLIDASRLALMKRSAFLVNIARGAVVDEDAVYAALRDRTIGGAALDVWWRYPDAAEPERRPSRHPFHELPNVIMTPHCSGWTEGMVARRWAEVAGNINRFARGEPLQNVLVTT